MPSLDDISERLFIRSQEAVLQLELWIRRQQHLSEIEHEHARDKIADQYNLYMAQLNSLCVRSEYVRDKLNAGYQNRKPPIVNEQNYIEDLVYEFQDITVKLNELAQNQKEQVTPSSKHSNGSVNSFQPRPLKITERYRTDIGATRQSPTRINGKLKNVNFVEESLPELFCPSKCTSLPGSPLKMRSPDRLPDRPLRVAKSYDTGLNPNSRAKLKKQKEEEMLSVFKENQRLSITFCDDIDEGSDSASDQNTVISTSPIPPSHPIQYDVQSEKPPLRRYNSHDSVLSTKVQPISSAKCPTFLTIPTANRPSMKSVTVSSAPIISSTGGKASSKDLLSSFISNTQDYDKKARNDNGNNNRFSSNLIWNLFKQKSQKNRNPTPLRVPQQDVTSERKENQLLTTSHPSGVYSSCSRLLVKNQNSSIISPTRQRITNGNTMYDELQEALDTELVL
ncbi:ZYRO0F18502p [Zygosaccharomyces rouxii]|uniref:ZYRO0F18502p n=2 Tax=Zygosaccharomyces rouxii TaxID=4956 RepID=C5DZ63_ZYGRC|nr:uncharacterized protein ZYRO0F18502g [Zygosaccharomyces rouxii]KAH9201215.1 hypothetical protein LQ764DRAFT_76707 [Zygosaccharomyces rouxii]CAQ43300.1 Uncharacterized protein YCL063W [Zygosaccharomyces rouxii]CAR29074.1 ZYRO0F18502p [Zygosaccharomyces rouxii]